MPVQQQPIVPHTPNHTANPSYCYTVMSPKTHTELLHSTVGNESHDDDTLLHLAVHDACTRIEKACL
jgi:hypothetical protein